MIKKTAATVFPISMSRSMMRSVFISVERIPVQGIPVQGVPWVQQNALVHTSCQLQLGLWCMP
jgi:hypothetical protein